MKNGILLLFVALGFLVMYTVLEHKSRKATEQMSNKIEALRRGYMRHEDGFMKQIRFDYAVDSTLTKELFFEKDSIK